MLCFLPWGSLRFVSAQSPAFWGGCYFPFSLTTVKEILFVGPSYSIAFCFLLLCVLHFLIEPSSDVPSTPLKS